MVSIKNVSSHTASDSGKSSFALCSQRYASTYSATSSSNGLHLKSGETLRAGRASYQAQERYFVAPTLNWRISQNTNLTLEGEYQRDEKPNGDAEITGLPGVGTVLPNPNGQISRNRNLAYPVKVHWVGNGPIAANRVLDNLFKYLLN